MNDFDDAFEIIAYGIVDESFPDKNLQTFLATIKI